MTTAIAEDNLEHLTRGRTIWSLEQLLGPEEASTAWASACRSAGFEPDQSLGLDDLEAVADALMAEDGTVALVGSSLAIRVRTYRMLEGASRLEAFLGPESTEDGAQT